MTTLQLKEELIDGEDYSFLQGASDQESNGSANFYIKQEPWGCSETEGGRERILHRTDFIINPAVQRGYSTGTFC